MMYSVFQPDRGLYAYYETPDALAFNADLPIPQLTRDAGKVGVAAIDAARALPANARRVGEGWNARGIIATPDPAPAFSGDNWAKTSMPYVAAVAVAALSYKVLDNGKRPPSDRAIAGVVAGTFVGYVLKDK